MKKYLFRFIVAALVLLLPSVLNLNLWIARHSVPLATYVTLYPFPFYIEGSYTTGSFRGISLGTETAKEALTQIAERGNCKALYDSELIDVDRILALGDDPLKISGELVLRCAAGGAAWNQILVLKNGSVAQVRISGGFWM